MNKVFLLGRLNNDAQNRTTQGGLRLCNRTMIVTEDSQQGPRSQTIKLVGFNKQGDTLAQVPANSLVTLEGRLRVRSWVNPQTGQPQESSEIAVGLIEVLNLGAQLQPQQPAATQQPMGAQHAPATQPMTAPPQGPVPASPWVPPPSPVEAVQDDIPF